MKIGFDISDLHAGRADGTTRYTFELAKRLPRLAPEHEWIYFSSGRPSKNYSLPTTRYQLVTSPWPRYWTQSRLWLDLYKYRPDVLFMPIQQLPYIRPGPMKTVCVVHDLAFHAYPDQFTYKDWALQHIFTAYVAREADHIIAVSAATAHDVAKCYGRTEKVRVIHHGVDHRRFRPPASEEEKEIAWHTLRQWRPQLKRPYLLYVGQIQPRKNLLRLIEAWEKLPDVCLVLAGAHGWLNKSIYDRAKSSSRSHQLLLTGRVPDELLPALYWQAEALVLPSLSEGFGMPLLEAMAAGCPSVTSNTSAMPEVAGGAAVLVDPLSLEDIEQGIRQARARRDELARAGIDRAAEFSWDQTAQQTLSLLQSP